MTLNEMDKYPHMKSHYIIMDNAAVKTHGNIGKCIKYCEYRCVHLPTYSPELSSIGQFRVAVKSKVKHHRFLHKDKLFIASTGRLEM